MTTTTRVLLAGAAGFLGGTVLYALAHDKSASNYEITAIIRNKDSAAAIQEVYPNVKVVIGSLGDAALVEELSSSSDAIINVAGSDDIEVVHSIIAGLKKYKERTNQTGIYIHLSGAASISVPTKGEATSEKVWDDSDLESFWDLPDAVPHRNVDKAVAHANGDVRVLVASPPFFYGGRGKGPVRRDMSTSFLNQLIRASLALKQTGYAGKGLASVSAIHVEDLANFLLLLLDLASKNDPRLKYGREGFYFPTTDEALQKDIADAIGKRLFERGLIETPNTRSWTEEEKTKYIGPFADFLFGSNMRCTGSRAIALGWKPIHGPDGTGMLSHESLDAEIDAAL